ncbi:hypothetical protein QOT17_012814 [Balamuthia mandrillaris]
MESSSSGAGGAPTALQLLSDEQKWSSPDVSWVKCIEDAIKGSDETTSVARNVVQIFEEAGRGFDLLQWAVDRETAKSAAATLFREDSMNTSLIREYVALKGRSFLEQMLRPPLQPFLKKKGNHQQSRVPKLTDAILNSVCPSSSLCPTAVRRVMVYICDKIGKDKEEWIYMTAIGNLFFLRLVTPLLLSSQKLSDLLGQVKITPEHVKTLIMVCKLLHTILSYISNPSLSFDKEGANEEWMQAKVEDVRQFLSALIQPVETDTNPDKDEQKESNPEVISKALLKIRNSITFCQEMRRQMQACLQADTGEPLRRIAAPPMLAPLFAPVEKKMEQYFAERLSLDYDAGVHQLSEDERYLALRGRALSVDFYKAVFQMFAFSSDEEASDFASNLLFDLSHSIGRNDARKLKSTGLFHGIELVAATSIHYAHTGWAFVGLETITQNADPTTNFITGTHAQSCEAHEWMLERKKHSNKKLLKSNPGCVMACGYSSGFVSDVLGVPCLTLEVLCKGKGDDRCQLLIAGRDAIEERMKQFLVQHKQTLSEKSLANARIPNFIASRLHPSEDDSEMLSLSRSSSESASTRQQDTTKEEESKMGVWFKKVLVSGFDAVVVKPHQQLKQQQETMTEQILKKKKKKATAMTQEERETAKEKIKNMWKDGLKLDPDHGIVRMGESKERYVMLRSKGLSCDFFSLIENLLGEEKDSNVSHDFAANFLYDFAKTIGHSDQKHVSEQLEMKKNNDIEVRSTALKMHMACMGFGRVTNVHTEADGYLMVEMQNSFEAHSWMDQWKKQKKESIPDEELDSTIEEDEDEKKDKRTEMTTCFVSAGYCCGWFESVWVSTSTGDHKQKKKNKKKKDDARRLEAAEVACVAMGHDCCRFIIAECQDLRKVVQDYFQSSSTTKQDAAQLCSPMLQRFLAVRSSSNRYLYARQSTEHGNDDGSGNDEGSSSSLAGSSSEEENANATRAAGGKRNMYASWLPRILNTGSSS